jgi:hypothetical protein
MSRADLPTEVEVKIEEIIARMAARERLSRADFGRQLRRLVAISLGQASAETTSAGP